MEVVFDALAIRPPDFPGHIDLPGSIHDTCPVVSMSCAAASPAQAVVAALWIGLWVFFASFLLSQVPENYTPTEPWQRECKLAKIDLVSASRA